MIHFDKDSEVSNLVMDILCSMALEVIPECLGHNYPLFLADKKAKYILGEMKTAYLSTVAFEMVHRQTFQIAWTGIIDSGTYFHSVAVQLRIRNL